MTEFYEVSRTKLAARNGRLAYTKIAIWQMRCTRQGS
jgi:hypothetical protein